MCLLAVRSGHVYLMYSEFDRLYLTFLLDSWPAGVYVI